MGKIQDKAIYSFLVNRGYWEMHKVRGRIKATVKWNSISSFPSTLTDFLQSGFEEDNGTESFRLWVSL